jgi:endonuclease/exonuclease/phosphatase family metal-dependent hydrolase
VRTAIFLTFFLVNIVVSGADGAPGTVRVATLNVHYLAEWSDDPLMNWSSREGAVLAVLAEIDADIVAFQEMETFVGGSYNTENMQAESVACAFPTHRFTATGDPRRFPNTQPILYRTDRFLSLEQGFFFFSPTPDVAYSDPWYGRYSSFASWTRLRGSGDERTILIVNLHIDASSYRNRARSVELVVDRIGTVRRPGDEVIVLGDFNAFRFSRIIGIVERGVGVRAVPGDGPTFHFYRGIGLFPAIDHILVSDGVEVLDTKTVRSRPDGVWPSDHYPFYADLRLDDDRD